ncbi:MAG: alanine--glyoxylate aminotransferase family protein [Thermotaleaceae bacterium]
MERRQLLQIPGPTNIPDRILRSLSQPLINHRGPEFEALLSTCVTGLKKVFRTENDILIFPSSGSGILESAIVNLFSPGDTILAVCLGVFSDRMAEIGEKHGLNVIRLTKEWGEAAKVKEIEALLVQDKEKKIKAVCLPQNETTSAIANDVEGIALMIKKLGHPAILVVDAISSLACVPLETDKWGIDVVVSASQKGLMLPPGIGVVALSPRAWEMTEKSTMARWYWDYHAVKEKMAAHQFPYTPSTSLLFGLKEALAIIEEEGLEQVWQRHHLIGCGVRNAAIAMGLELFSEAEYASDTVSAIKMPGNISYKEFAGLLRTKYGIVIGGGLQKIQGKIFRVGHMGSFHFMDAYTVMGGIEMALYELGYGVELGTAAAALGKTVLECS